MFDYYFSKQFRRDYSRMRINILEILNQHQSKCTEKMGDECVEMQVAPSPQSQQLSQIDVIQENVNLNRDGLVENCEVQFGEMNDSYMSPLEYETESDDENDDQIRPENSICEYREQDASSSSQFGAIAEINSTSSERVLKAIHRERFPGINLGNLCHRYLTRNLTKRHGQRKSYSCYLCEKSYKSNQWLRKHMASKHIDQVPVRFYCTFPTCSKSFSQKSTLNKHIKLKHG